MGKCEFNLMRKSQNNVMATNTLQLGTVFSCLITSCIAKDNLLVHVYINKQLHKMHPV